MSAREVIDALTRPTPPAKLNRAEWDSFVADILTNVREYLALEAQVGHVQLDDFQHVSKRIWDLALQLEGILGWFQPPVDLLLRYRHGTNHQRLVDDTEFTALVVEQADGWAQTAQLWKWQKP